MGSIRMENISKTFKVTEKYHSIYDITFEAREGELFAIIGPTNSGKTEILRLIAGLEQPDSGKVFINEKEANKIAANQRGIAMLFESLALYPNKNGFDNIAFPLKVKKVPKSQIKKRVMEIAKMLDVQPLMHRTPDTYSGGEKQRVALGRMFVQEPNAYLLDEPFGGLDARLRIAMRTELKKIQRDLVKPMVFASHDQEDAMSLADHIAVIKEGHIQQIGTPQEIYAHPCNLYVAKAIGKPIMNFYHCNLNSENGKLFAVHEHFRIGIHDIFQKGDKTSEKDEVIIGIRPEHIKILKNRETEEDIPATMLVTEPLGDKTIINVKVGCEKGHVITFTDAPLEINKKIWLGIRKDKLYIFDKLSEKAIN